jgi:hypothetical protein
MVAVKTISYKRLTNPTFLAAYTTPGLRQGSDQRHHLR